MLIKQFHILSYLFLALMVFISADMDRQYLLLTLFMLFLPLLDRQWQIPVLRPGKFIVIQWLLLLTISVGLIALNVNYWDFFTLTLFFAALPEEWFFRAYLMPRIGTGIKANLLASAAFSLLHAISFDMKTALLVFIPSLVYGWIYQQQKDIITIILLHALSNLVYTIYLYQYF